MVWFLILWCLLGYWVIAVLARCKVKNETGSWDVLDKCIGIIFMWFGILMLYMSMEYIVAHGDKDCFVHPLWNWPWYSKK